MHRSHDEDGATAVEYAVMVALIAVVIFGAVALVGESVVSLFDDFLVAMGWS